MACTAEVGSSPNTPVTPNNLTGIPSLLFPVSFPASVLLFLLNEVGLIFPFSCNKLMFTFELDTRQRYSVTDTKLFHNLGTR